MERNKRFLLLEITSVGRRGKATCELRRSLKGTLNSRVARRERDAGYLIFNPNTLEGDSVTDTPDLRGISAHPMKSFSGVVSTRVGVPDRFPGRAEPSFHLVTRTIISIQFCLKISILKKRYQPNVKIYFLHYISISVLVELLVSLISRDRNNSIKEFISRVTDSEKPDITVDLSKERSIDRSDPVARRFERRVSGPDNSRRLPHDLTDPSASAFACESHCAVSRYNYDRNDLHILTAAFVGGGERGRDEEAK